MLVIRMIYACPAWLAIGLVFGPTAVLAGEEEQLALAVADQALEFINAEDMVGFTDLMLEEAVLVSTSFRDGIYRHQVRSRAEERANQLDYDINERGFDPTVMVAGPVAMVWYPYDLYVDDVWTHCGVDVFSLVRTEAGWKIASLTWSALQPPACQPHPDGPPPGAEAPQAP